MSGRDPGRQPERTDRSAQAAHAGRIDEGDQATDSEAARRIIRLLWDPPVSPPARGPKPKITLDDVVEAGIAVADAEGLDALSMRKVATRLGVGAMSLYTYVPGRDELIELMVDRVHGELDLPAIELPWRASVEQQVKERWRMYERHPWLLDFNMARMPVGPHVLDADEAFYAALLRAGFEGADVVSATNLITWQLLGAARSEIVEADVTRRTGTSAEAYWNSRMSFWETYFDYDRYPAMAAIWAAGGFDDEEAHAFDRQLSRLLGGLESRLKPR
ncbi:TetR family transcriptional regulator [Microlunatus phosphovorus NM-1]|uniref:TetR family transcriptional regulator n=1 Tax=Microlunatus phosphovorus (strain ATCC 700054 / DSM 10555 / JCM 9379 / NBRC 101784 / NCIMB 13414 / VKM Ac-1990 / NM-1) TaxID=1032480 RepID=F5XHK8_MICPN|nr:TetR/AcrR family transcriptional regulator [Microlunatus phosphovorus]BAK33153.1 TetR family transcriptional regulator [Microlunatus phosphovorus NM-1]